MAVAVKIAGSPNFLRTETFTIGTTATQVLLENKNRAGYRIIASDGNTGIIYHDKDGNVTTSSLDQILAGGRLEDMGEWDTIYRGEVWLISGSASQSATVEEIVKV